MEERLISGFCRAFLFLSLNPWVHRGLDSAPTRPAGSFDEPQGWDKRQEHEATSMVQGMGKRVLLQLCIMHGVGLA